jgi:glycosyltransferase involved in cell wall biosynthesis
MSGSTRVLADVLPLQVGNTRERGIGRYTYRTLSHLLQQPAKDEFHVLVGNVLLPRPAPLPRNAATPYLYYAGDYPIRAFRADRWSEYMAGHTTYWQRQIDRFACNIFHVHNPFEWQTPQHAHNYHISLVVTVHDLIPLRLPDIYLNPMPRWLQDGFHHACKFVSAADRIIVNSECTRDDLIELLDIEPNKISVAYPGPADHIGDSPDPELERSLRRRFRLAGGFVLSHSGFDPRKNLSRTLRSYSQLEPNLRRDYPLVVVCRLDPVQGKTLRSEAHELGISDRLILTNYLGDAELAAIYHMATVQFLPSLYEGFGSPVLDSMVAGLPVVTSNSSALAEVAGDAAVLVDPLDIGAMATAMRTVLLDESLRASLRQKGRLRGAKFSWDITAGTFRKVYHEMVNVEA